MGHVVKRGVQNSVSASILERIRRYLVSLCMLRALEALGATLKRLEQGAAQCWKGPKRLLSEEFTTHETRRIQDRDSMAKAGPEGNLIQQLNTATTSSPRSVAPTTRAQTLAHAIRTTQRDARVAAAKRAIAANVWGAMAAPVCAAA